MVRISIFRTLEIKAFQQCNELFVLFFLKQNSWSLVGTMSFVAFLLSLVSCPTLQLCSVPQKQQSQPPNAAWRPPDGEEQGWSSSKPLSQRIALCDLSGGCLEDPAYKASVFGLTWNSPSGKVIESESAIQRGRKRAFQVEEQPLPKPRSWNKLGVWS